MLKKSTGLLTHLCPGPERFIQCPASCSKWTPDRTRLHRQLPEPPTEEEFTHLSMVLGSGLVHCILRHPLSLTDLKTNVWLFPQTPQRSAHTLLSVPLQWPVTWAARCLNETPGTQPHLSMYISSRPHGLKAERTRCVMCTERIRTSAP